MSKDISLVVFIFLLINNKNMTKRTFNKIVIIILGIGAATALTGGIMYLFDGFFDLDSEVNYPAFVVGEVGLLIMLIAPIAKAVEMGIDYWRGNL